MDAKIKLYLLSGSMGSGKSSFLKNLLSHHPGEKIGIIVNEFGRIACGGTTYKKNGVTFVKSNNGSVFCSCKRAYLVDAMEEMADHPLKYLFIEAASIADLAGFCDVINEVAAPEREVFEYSGVIYIVDGLYFLDQLENLEVVVRQLQHSNLAVINKVDLIGKKTIEKIKAKILEVNPGMIIKEAQFGKFDYSFLNEDLIKEQPPACEDARKKDDDK
jgi:G3E family GTPase